MGKVVSTVLVHAASAASLRCVPLGRNLGSRHNVWCAALLNLPAQTLLDPS